MEKLKINDSLRPHIKNIIPFRFLSDDELDELITSCSILKYEEHEWIINQGELDQSLFAVIQGSVKVTVESEQGEAYICTLGNAEVFGEAGMFMKVERSANVICVSESIIFKIDRSHMLKFVKKNPLAGNKIFMVMIYSLLRKLKEANRELAYERRSDIDQTDIDDLVSGLLCQ